MPKKSEGGNIQVALAINSSLTGNGSSIPGIHEGFPPFPSLLGNSAGKRWVGAGAMHTLVTFPVFVHMWA